MLTEFLCRHIGAGGVGACFLKQLAFIAQNHETVQLKLCFIGIIDKAYYHQDYAAIDIDSAYDTLERNGVDLPPIEQTIEFLSKAPKRVVAVDNTSSMALASSYPAFLKKGISIVTPNKKAFSSGYDLWLEILAAAAVGSSHVYHESSVGAGLPIISTMHDMFKTGDDILKIEGVFSGTMSYLLNSFSPVEGRGQKWSEEVKTAKTLGYTEPDPRDDLNGLDVARKLTILGRLCGMAIKSPTSFPVESMIPKELESAASSDDFLSQLHNFDDQMDARQAEAEKTGRVLRFVGRIDLTSKEAKVGLELFDKSHPIARLQGSDNMISLHTKRYKERPLIVQGAGAGGEVTAMGVAGDLLKVLDRIT